MKIVIDIPNYNNLNDIQNGSIACSQVLRAVKNGKPYEERPQGEWITRETPEGTTYLIECPVCGYQKGNKWVVFTALPPYCECCGAKLGADNETHD